MLNDHIPIVPPSLQVKSTDFIDGWAQMIYKIYHYGVILPTEYGNLSRDACMTITFTGNAINQIIDGHLHPADPYSSSGMKKLTEYRKQFTNEFKWEKQGFDYTYLERLSNYYNLDQLQLLTTGLNIISRRNIAITWMPKKDAGTDHPPCMQYIWIRRLPIDGTEQSVAKLFKQLLELKSQGNYSKGSPTYLVKSLEIVRDLQKLMSKYIEVHTTFRSHDAYGGTGPNSHGILNMVNDLVNKDITLQKSGELTYDNLKIAKYVIFDDSSHIYEPDWKAASKIIPMNFNKILSHME